MTPIRAAVLDDHEIDLAGVMAVLGRFEARIQLVDFTPTPSLDVILYGVRERGRAHDPDLHALLRSQDASVIVLGWGPEAPEVRWALSCGAHGHLSKTLTGEEIVSGVEQIHRTRDLGRVLPADGECHPAVQAVGLTPRELEVLALITQGLTNQEIADRAYISINSVKTYVRTAYRKIGVTRRSNAVSWGIHHGLEPDPGHLALQVEAGGWPVSFSN